MLGKEHTLGTDQTNSQIKVCLDLTLAVHRRVHTEVEGKTRQKNKF